MPILDPPTFLFSLAISSLVMALLSLSFAHAMPSRDVGLADWGRCMLVAMVTCWLYAMRGEWPMLLTFTVPNLALFLFPRFAHAAYAKLLGIRANHAVSSVLAGLAASALIGEAALGLPRRVAIATVIGSLAVLLFIQLRTVMRHADWRHDRSTWLTLVSIAALGIALVVRFLGVTLGIGSDHTLYAHSRLMSFTMVASSIMILGTSLGYFLMAHSALRTDLEEHARRDGLTGLLNRETFLSSSEGVATGATVRGYALVMIDLDHFKRINDTWGHAAGDTVLRETARRLDRAVRATDLVARYGGEEFCVMMLGCDRADAERSTARIIAAIAEEPYWLADGTAITVTASAGLSWRDGATGAGAPGRPIERMFEAADKALYNAKDAGRNRVATA